MDGGSWKDNNRARLALDMVTWFRYSQAPCTIDYIERHKTHEPTLETGIWYVPVSEPGRNVVKMWATCRPPDFFWPCGAIGTSSGRPRGDRGLPRCLADCRHANRGRCQGGARVDVGRLEALMCPREKGGDGGGLPAI